MSLKSGLEKPHLQALRSFLDFVDSNPTACTGILSLLTQSQHSSTQRTTELWDLQPVYTSDTRLACMKMCGWGDDQEPASLDVVYQENETLGLFTRSAMIAMMNFNSYRAVLALKNSPVRYGALVSLLETFPLKELDDRMKMLFSKLANSEEDEYISSLLLFLSGLSPSQILLRKRLEVRDRLAVACRFYQDSSLLTFIKAELEQSKASGDPHGILLTGLTAESVPIIEKYLQRTKDRETGAVLGVYLLKYSSGDSARAWVEDYTAFLNSEGLFEQRCLFDIEKNRMLGTTVTGATSGQSLRCYMCGKSLGVPQMVSEIGHKIAWNELHTKSILNHCPHCKKLLPKCALCLRPISSLNPYLQLSNARSGQGALRPQELGYGEWVGWCQKCRHGGHVGHLAQWFETNAECPVSGCRCRCNVLDEDTS